MELLMGNEAMGLGAIHAGVEIVSGYPGTPSSEVLEYIASLNEKKNIYIEWSVNEKAAVEVAAGASYAGKRSLVTMKQVGLNAASDPVMNLAYIGVKGGMVILIADDPGPISSQTEQDTRAFGPYSTIPILDPSSPQEAYDLMIKAFELSEEIESPVIIRPTTRVCHGRESVEANKSFPKKDLGKFEKDPKWVVFPRTSYLNHIKVVERNERLSEDFSKWEENFTQGNGRFGIVSGGISYQYVMEALSGVDENSYKILKITTPYPFPKEKARDFCQSVDKILVVEELSPYIEEELIKLKGLYGFEAEILGKKTGHLEVAGENSVEDLQNILGDFLAYGKLERNTIKSSPPARPPVLCAGCPHRASFYTIKKATKGMRAVYAGDIGCYTLGNAQPLDMVDTCLCMGGGVTIAQGLSRSEEDLKAFAFIGDSTFFHSGITSIINAVYNQTDMVLVVLDNRITAMTGEQPHPGTGKTMMGTQHEKMDIGKILQAIGIEPLVLNAFEVEDNLEKVRALAEEKGVRAIIFEGPCIKLVRPEKTYQVIEEKCIACKKCVNEIGCPALVKGEGKKITIDQALCYGCDICRPICPTDAIVEVSQ